VSRRLREARSRPDRYRLVLQRYDPETRQYHATGLGLLFWAPVRARERVARALVRATRVIEESLQDEGG
jgi:hypothetical protein